MHQVSLDKFSIANNLPLTIIAGPCQMESLEHALFMSEQLSNICRELGVSFIYKTSYDKANRTSSSGKRGVGLEASIPVFQEIKNKIGCPILTDVHTEEQCSKIAPFVDILQIPAFLCRQTDLLKKAAETGKIVNVKKGQFLAPWDMKNVVKKLEEFGAASIMLTERGASFGYNTLVTDMRSLTIMAETGYPVVFDATHSVQQPGGMGNQSGGSREFVPILARAAVAVGVAAVFMEVHQDPDNAPSDGPCMVKLGDFYDLVRTLIKYDELNSLKERKFEFA